VYTSCTALLDLITLTFIQNINQNTRRDHFGDLGINGRISKWVLNKQDLRIWTGLIWLRIRPVAGPCERGNEPSGFIKARESLD
jgi:hypothetical protein